MFYDEKKSPYQYIYGSNILERTEHEVNLYSELERIRGHKIFSKNKNIAENYIKIYNIKEEIENIIFALYGKENVLNISIGGSYLFKKDNMFSDIDFNVIIKGNGFYYNDIPSTIIGSFITNKIPCSKISIICFGENLFLKQPIGDFIITPNYLHRDMTMREGIVWSLRNINLYGYLFMTNDKDLDRYNNNLNCRIQRQLKFANFIYDGLFDHYNSEEKIVTKMASRIGEAGIYLFNNDVSYDIENYFKIFIGEHQLSANELYQEMLNLQKNLSLS